MKFKYMYMYFVFKLKILVLRTGLNRMGSGIPVLNGFSRIPLFAWSIFAYSQQRLIDQGSRLHSLFAASQKEPGGLSLELFVYFFINFQTKYFCSHDFSLINSGKLEF